MGVVYKFKKTVVDFVIRQKAENQYLSCRTLADIFRCSVAGWSRANPAGWAYARTTVRLHRTSVALSHTCFGVETTGIASHRTLA